MAKHDMFHIEIKPETKSKLKYKSEKTNDNTLPSSIGHIFKNKEEIKEEKERLTLKDFLK